MNLSLNYCWLGSLLINHFLAGLVRFFPVSTEFIMIKLVTKQSISLKISRENVVTKEQLCFLVSSTSTKQFLCPPILKAQIDIMKKMSNSSFVYDFIFLLTRAHY